MHLCAAKRFGRGILRLNFSHRTWFGLQTSTLNCNLEIPNLNTSTLAHTDALLFTGTPLRPIDTHRAVPECLVHREESRSVEII